MRLPFTIFFTLLIASLVNALVITPNNVNDKRQLDIPSSILLAAEKSASALAAAYISSLNSKLNAKTVTEPEGSLQMPAPAEPTPPPPPSPAIASNSNEVPAVPTITSSSSPSSTVYAWTSYVTVATVTTYVWTGTGTPTGWPFETTAVVPPPLGPAENTAPAMLVSGVFTGMVAVVFSVIVLLIV